MLKNKKGITLIALVVTIVVLLILAGVTINLLLDENGIIAKSKDARSGTRASQVEDEVGMWKQHNFINKESNQAQESADTMLESLISRKLLTEDEIDRDQELITIKKKDGTIIKEISYSSVTINISKSPENKKSGYVELTVESVEGMTIPIITNEEELNNFVNSLSEEQKKDIIKRSVPAWVNKNDSSVNCTTFEQVLEYWKNKNWIEEATEELFWNDIESKGGIDRFLKAILINLYLDRATGKINGYIVTNPDNEESNTYTAMDNGTYAFKVKDLITGKIYTKKVQVTNVDKDIVVEPENIADWEYTEEDDGTITITSYKGTDTTVIIPNSINGKKVKKLSGDTTGSTASHAQYFSIWNKSICNGNEYDNASVGYCKGQDTITKVIISPGIEEIGTASDGVFTYSTALKEIIIPDTVVKIGPATFWGCKELKKVNIPKKVDTISERTFGFCTNLESITIPSNVTSIGENAFGMCKNLSSIIIPSSVTAIGDYAFSGCENLSNIIIPSSVTSIGNHAFSGCSNLLNITIPSSVTSIGDHAFSVCSNLLNITIPASVTTMGSEVFGIIPSITVNVPFKEGEQPSGWDANWNQTNSDCTITVNYAK